MIIAAPNEVVIAGRGTGKTIGILAPKSAKYYLDGLPRGTHVNINATFTQAFTRTLKELIRGWQNIGYVMDHHFIVCQKPTEKWKNRWKWKGPFAPPIDYKYFISWWNGSVMQLVSQERIGSSNGVSIDSIIGDEAKLLNEEKLKTELLPANRGIIPEFSGNPYHHGVTLTTDMPVGSSGRWLLDRAKAMDNEKVNQIWKIQTIRHYLKNQLYPKANRTTKKELENQLSILDQELIELRTNLLYYHEASSLDNIHALGIDYIKQQLRDTSPFQFDTQILNRRPLRMEDGFYPDFNEEYHGYLAEDPTYFDNVSFDFTDPELDCRKDTDVNNDQPLHISIDYNRRIHPIVIGQVFSDELRIVNGLHSLYPGKLKEALELFCKYYKYHKKKVVYYWYDHTAVGGINETEICKDVVANLKSNGWLVIEKYIGKQPGHETRYRMFGHLLKEEGYYSRKLRINRENCRSLIISIGMAEAEQRKEGFGKSKKTEHDNNVPADESTHYSDAFDTLVYGILESKIPFTTSEKPRETIIMR